MLECATKRSYEAGSLGSTRSGRSRHSCSAMTTTRAWRARPERPSQRSISPGVSSAPFMLKDATTTSSSDGNGVPPGPAPAPAPEPAPAPTAAPAPVLVPVLFGASCECEYKSGVSSMSSSSSVATASTLGKSTLTRILAVSPSVCLYGPRGDATGEVERLPGEVGVRAPPLRSEASAIEIETDVSKPAPAPTERNRERRLGVPPPPRASEVEEGLNQRTSSSNAIFPLESTSIRWKRFLMASSEQSRGGILSTRRNSDTCQVNAE